MNNPDSNLPDLNSEEWLSNVKFEKATVRCDNITYDKTSSLYGCKVNNSDKAYCYTDDTVTECNKNKLSRVYGESIQNGTPTPTSPVEVQSVGIYEQGNLYKTGYSPCYMNDDNQPNSFGFGSNSCSDYINVSNARKFKVSCKDDGSHASCGDIYFYNSSREYIANQSLSAETEIDTNLLYDCTYVVIIGDKTEYSLISSESAGQYKIPITLSNGTETKTTNIYLKEPLRKIGEYADYLDLTNKKVVRYVKEIVFNGTESWQKHNNLNTYYINDISIKHSDNISCYSNKYKGQVSGSGNSYGSGNMWVQSISSYPRIYISNDNYTTVDTFKTYLTSSNVTGYFVLETPIEESIDVPVIPSLTGNVTYTINTNIKPSKIEYGY